MLSLPILKADSITGYSATLAKKEERQVCICSSIAHVSDLSFYYMLTVSPDLYAEMETRQLMADWLKVC